MPSTVDTLEVLYEDNHIIVINKKVGDLVQSDKTGDLSLRDLVMQYLKVKYNKPGNVFLGVVHRLDRPTSGGVLFAKTSKSLSRLNKMFKDKEVSKTYWAIVNGHLKIPKATLIHYLVRNPNNNTSRAYFKEVPNSKKGVLHYTVIKMLDNFSLLEIMLETGRHHQIRAQMKSLGHSIKGDLKYGGKRSNPDAGINLHARRLQLIHPVKKTKIDITAPLPKGNLWEVCE